MEQGFTLWRYRRAFQIGTARGLVTLRSRTNGLFSELSLNGDMVAQDSTPVSGPDAVRNHLLIAALPDGTPIAVEAGWISSLNTAIAVRCDGVLVHESHPGQTITFPEKYREAVISTKAKSLGGAVSEGWNEGLRESGETNDVDFSVWKKNRIPLGIDIALGLLFFAVAKMTDLTTAALIGAAVGLALWGAQRLTKVDLLGGLAMFGIVLMLISAGLAFLFQSDDAVKYRTTAMGLLSASLFFADGLAGGKRLAVRLMRYLPYPDLDPARLGIGMGIMGVVMAGMNFAVAMLTSTDVWLFYSTFVDFLLVMGLIVLVFRYARGEALRDWAPRYRPPGDDRLSQ